jgi:hypothetical protein
MDKNFLALIALCLVAGSLYWKWQQATTIKEQQNKIEELITTTVATPTRNVDLQEKCATRAEALRPPPLEPLSTWLERQFARPVPRHGAGSRFRDEMTRIIPMLPKIG